MKFVRFFNVTVFNFRKNKHKEFRNMYITDINSDKKMNKQKDKRIDCLTLIQL